MPWKCWPKCCIKYYWDRGERKKENRIGKSKKDEYAEHTFLGIAKHLRFML